MAKTRVALLGLVVAFLPAHLDAQSVREISEYAGPSVFQIVGEYGDGTGFLVDSRRGLVLTNAHVTAGADTVGVKLDPLYKIEGIVLHEDRRTDIALVRVNLGAIARRPPVALNLTAYEEAAVGDQVVVMGYPVRTGVVTTTGIISQKSEGVLLMDADVNPGNSGGPVLTMDGEAIGVTTFLVGEGSGLGGAVTAAAVAAAIEGVSVPPPQPPPSRDSLLVMPRDDFPLEVLEAAVLAEDWPVGVYDVSDESRVGGYDIRLVTPPLAAREATELEDLQYWRQGVAGMPPVVFLRVHPQVGQSGAGFLANLILGAAAGFSGSVYVPVYDPRARGNLDRVVVQRQFGGVIPQIQTKRATAVIDGQRVQVVHAVLQPEIFAPDQHGDWPELLTIQVWDVERGLLFWTVPEETMKQIYSDFRVYLESR